nr:MAG TPA: hypothetical protein [Caudoviricetes sp.]
MFNKLFFLLFSDFSNNSYLLCMTYPDYCRDFFQKFCLLLFL